MCMSKSSSKDCAIAVISRVLVAMGGINWGLIGMAALLDNDANVNLVNLTVGQWPIIEAVVYLTIGLAGVIVLCGCCCTLCSYQGSCKCGKGACACGDKDKKETSCGCGKKEDCRCGKKS